MRDPKDIRLFFALWPDDDTRRRLQQAANSVEVVRPARRVPLGNLHLTLHFIGNVYFDEMACMQQRAAAVAAKGFDLIIDSRGSFDKARVAWLGCRKAPAALLELHCELGASLIPCGFRVETRPYNPHVTVARKIRQVDDKVAFEPVPWRVDEFALIEVQTVENGVEYRVVESWTLT